jgi:hypothetical protein
MATVKAIKGSKATVKKATTATKKAMKKATTATKKAMKAKFEATKRSRENELRGLVRVGQVRKKLTVFNGTIPKTSSGLTRACLIKNKRNKIVSKKQQAAGKKAYARIEKWTEAVQKARNALGIFGFVAVKKGTPLYMKAKEFYQ